MPHWREQALEMRRLTGDNYAFRLATMDKILSRVERAFAKESIELSRVILKGSMGIVWRAVDSGGLVMVLKRGAKAGVERRGMCWTHCLRRGRQSLAALS